MITDSILKKIIWPKPGSYIVAVSGGVDSVTLLHFLLEHISRVSKVQPWKLVVAHFDHGIRPDSNQDAQLVKQLAKKYNLVFELGRGKLGAKASEATARQARYKFLEAIKKKHQADGIITAHHLDDKIETALLNLRRGTGRHGLTPFRNNKNVVRPLKNVLKQELIDYARKHGLEWRTDATNYDLRARRNYLRHIVIPALEAEQTDFKQWLSQRIREIEFDNYQIDQELEEIKQRISAGTKNGLVIKRSPLIMMSQRLVQEFLHYVINQLKPGADISANQIKRFARFCKTARPRATLQLSQELQAQAAYDRVTVTYSSRQA